MRRRQIYALKSKAAQSSNKEDVPLIERNDNPKMVLKKRRMKKQRTISYDSAIRNEIANRRLPRQK